MTVNWIALRLSVVDMMIVIGCVGMGYDSRVMRITIFYFGLSIPFVLHIYYITIFEDKMS